MKKRITFLLAALVLLSGFAWGQSDYSDTHTSNVTLSTVGGTSASACSVIVGQDSYEGIKAGTGSKAGAWVVSVPENTNYLHLHMVGWNGENTVVTITGATANPSTISLTSVASGNSPYSVGSYEDAASYYTVISLSSITKDTEITFTATSGRRFVVWGVNAEESSTPSTDPVLSVNPNAIDLGEVAINTEAEATFTVNQANLTSDITLSAENGELDITSITAGADETEVTYTITPDVASDFTDVITLTCDDFDDPITINVTGTCFDPNNADTYNPVGIAELTTDDVFVIVGIVGENHYAMSNDNGTSSAPTAVAVTPTADGSILNPDANILWKIGFDDEGNYIFYSNNNTDSWLYCTNTNNGVRVGTNNDKTFTIDQGYLYHVGTGRYVGVYSAQDWRCYTSINSNITGQTFAFYKLSNGEVFIPAPTFNPAAGTYTEAISVEIIHDSESIFYTLDGTEPAHGVEGSTMFYEGPIAISETTTIKAIAWGEVNGEEVWSNVATAEYVIDILQPMTIAEARALEPGSMVLTSGTVTSCVVTTGYIQDATAAICVYGEALTVGDNITVSGTLDIFNGLVEIKNPVVTVVSSGNTIEPEVMTIAEINASSNQGWYIRIEEATVTEISGQNTTITQDENSIVVRGITGVDIAVGNVISLNGNIGCYDNTQIANPQNVEVQVAPVVPTINITPDVVNFVATDENDPQIATLDIAYTNIVAENYQSFTVEYCDAEGATQEQPQWLVVGVTAVTDGNSIVEGEFQVRCIVTNNTGEARTAYFKVYAMDEETNLVYSNLVTVNQDAYVENTTYTLTTTIESGRHYIIVGYKNNDAYAMGAQGNNNRSAESITLTNTGASVDLEVVSEFIINGPDADGNYTIYDAYDAVGPGYLFAASSNSNYLRTEEFVDANGKWAITFNEENNAANIVAQGSNTRNVMRYNPNNNIFACYASGQNDVYLYVRDEEENYEFVTDITGYSSVENTAGGYYLIASPVNNVNPATVNGMLDNDYDLYYFNQSATNEEWQNYKANNFSLESGKGYLYANSETFTMHFTGTPQTPNESYVQLAYDANSEFAGMNLVGNPWGYAVSIDRPFYTLNDEGSEVVPSVVEAINPMQGVFVEADTDGETMYFTPYVPSSSSKLVLNVNKNRGALVDRTIISFDNNGRLPKFMINPDNTKIYIPQDNAEFAVVQSDDIEAEMPVNFKVNENGFYMINVDVKNMDLDYLHLIDHKTGNDVDLLATPNYGFNANISDYEARFSLVYRTFTGVNENNSETFAYFNGSEWVINNGENATVQVIDMLGRIVMSANNANSISTATMAPGTYVLRLTNGSEVMTQKIVVE